jgi:hypothetical protein
MENTTRDRDSRHATLMLPFRWVPKAFIKYLERLEIACMSAAITKSLHTCTHPDVLMYATQTKR